MRCKLGKNILGLFPKPFSKPLYHFQIYNNVLSNGSSGGLYFSGGNTYHHEYSTSGSTYYYNHNSGNWSDGESVINEFLAQQAQEAEALGISQEEQENDAAAWMSRAGTTPDASVKTEEEDEVEEAAPERSGSRVRGQHQPGAPRR